MSPFRRQTLRAENALVLLRLFYALQLGIFTNSLFSWMEWRSSERIYPIWPTYFFEYFGIQTSVDVVCAGYLALTCILCLVPQYRSLRFIHFIFLLLYVAIPSSFGKINHNLHFYLYVTFIFTLLPTWNNRSQLKRIFKQKLLWIFSSAQALVLIPYSLAGYWKFSTCYTQFISGKESALSLNAFSYLITKRLMETDRPTLLGSWVIDQPELGRAMLLSAMTLELLSVIVVFVPRLHRFWGLSLIGFHIGTKLIFGIDFHRNIFILGIFLVCSPFANHGKLLMLPKIFRARMRKLS